MAIAFDSAAFGETPSSGGNQVMDWNHTCTGSNLGLVVGIIDLLGAQSNMSFNGTFGTPKKTTLSGASNMSATLWWLPNPSTGTHTVEVVRASGGSRAMGFSLSYTGVDPTQPDSVTPGNTTSTGSFTLSTTVVHSNCWLIGLGGDYLSTLTGITTNKTDRTSDYWNPFAATPLAGVMADSNGTVSTGSQGITFTSSHSGGTATDNYAAIVMSLAPLGTFPSAANPLFFAGD